MGWSRGRPSDLPGAWFTDIVLRFIIRHVIRSSCDKIRIIRWSYNILSQFTKFVLGDLKYMTHYHGNYDIRLFYFRLCIWYGHPYPFYRFVLVPARTCTSIWPSAQHFHNTAINVTSSRRQPLAALTACRTTRTRSSAARFYILARTLYTSFTQRNVLLFFSSSVRYVEN